MILFVYVMIHTHVVRHHSLCHRATNGVVMLSAEQGLAHAWMGLANSIKEEVPLIDMDIIRSAHKKVTATRKVVEPKIDEKRTICRG